MIPLKTEYSYNTKVNLAKYKKIMIEAVEQSEGIKIPNIEDAQTVKEVLFNWDEKRLIVFCDEKEYKVSKFSCSTHPHNTYVQILAETGIIGFLFLVFALFYFCKHTFNHLFLKFKGKYYFTDFEICILSGIIIYVWPFVPTANIFNNWINIAMILNFPFLIWSRKQIKDD